jgi:hypothetical protein
MEKKVTSDAIYYVIKEYLSINFVINHISIIFVPNEKNAKVYILNPTKHIY